MSVSKLAREFAGPTATVFVGAMLVISDMWTADKVEKKVNDFEKNIEKKIGDAKTDLEKGVMHAQQIAAGAPLVLMTDRNKVPLMAARMKAFGACVRGGGGQGCVKGKE